MGIDKLNLANNRMHTICKQHTTSPTHQVDTRSDTLSIQVARFPRMLGRIAWYVRQNNLKFVSLAKYSFPVMLEHRPNIPFLFFDNFVAHFSLTLTLKFILQVTVSYRQCSQITQVFRSKTTSASLRFK
mgnify:CR=1 FL=1